MKGSPSASNRGSHASNYKEKFPKKSPFGGGIVALHVTIRNNGDESVKVDLQHIRLLLILGEENRQELTPLTADDVADTVLLKGGKDPTQRRNPLPMPVGKPNPTQGQELDGVPGYLPECEHPFPCCRIAQFNGWIGVL